MALAKIRWSIFLKPIIFWSGVSFGSETVMESIKEVAPYMVPSGSPQGSMGHCGADNNSNHLKPQMVTCKSSVECDIELIHGKVILVLNGLEPANEENQKTFFLLGQNFSQNFLSQVKITVKAVTVKGKKTYGDVCVDGKLLREELLKKGFARVSRENHVWSNDPTVSLKKKSNGAIALTSDTGSQKVKDLQGLFSLEAKAKKAAVGMWSTALKSPPQPKNAPNPNFPLMQ